jgi:hypothetical protein
MNGSRIEHLLECLIQVIARAALSEDRVREVVGSGKKQIKAFNLCDGTNTQTEIAKKAGVDLGNFNRASRRWIEHGVAFAVGDGRDARLLHVFPISTSDPKRPMARKKAKKN